MVFYTVFTVYTVHTYTVHVVTQSTQYGQIIFVGHFHCYFIKWNAKHFFERVSTKIKWNQKYIYTKWNSILFSHLLFHQKQKNGKLSTMLFKWKKKKMLRETWKI